MEIRRMAAADMLSSEKTRHMVFHGSMDVEKRAADLAEHPADTRGWWGCYEGDELAGSVHDTEFDMRFDGHTVKMGGIGGVNTRPEYRMNGCIRKIMMEVLKAGRENGEIFSSLYPFQHSFYRKFGYEPCWIYQRYTIPMAELANFKHTGWVKIWKKGDDVSEYTRLYNEHSAGQNCAVVRDDQRMKNRISDTPFKDQKYMYLLGDEEGACAYVCWQWKPASTGGNLFSVQDYAYVGSKGLKALFGFMGRFTAEYAAAEIRLPREADPRLFVKHPYDITVRDGCDFMARIMNVPKALELMKKPENCRFIVGVTDEMLPENSGNWLVTNEGVEKTEEAADLTVSIHRLNQLVLGFANLDAAMMHDDICLHDNEEMLRKTFVCKTIHIEEFF